MPLLFLFFLIRYYKIMRYVHQLHLPVRDMLPVRR